MLYPAALPTFERRVPSADVSELVRWFWISQWDIAPGRVSRQELLPFPALNLVVEQAVTGLSGAATAIGHRDLTGRGFAVGALLKPAATPALTADPQAILDTYSPMDLPDLSEPVASAMARGDVGAACAAYESWLRAGPRPSAEGLLANRLAALIEDDETLRTVDDVAAATGTSARTVQRLTRKYIGLTPLALIHRRRLQHAAELLRTEPDLPMARIAADLGYADQAHLIRDFRKVLGFTPGGYRRDLR
ncbi:Transcriptional regulator, AraC family OS=Tsukamurella paurometabola (strain ATCC 8368 / DSM/ CCUG 35730 / CIP 100753 / JCM 10117 / KCTC 9821 / NBRC 16120/ NCIMB 702349 / NCTC 13040) OX=521096 GN=Tpau_2463 PE=4 SV=1 [Tsukamurella paurometabola]|uniref:Transcriptional regulator, AraC family n=1 Tax=Tsukamurella paurometabola (strain ATCC 8368 / DSM 20162 / CCUG 35730 / CIP 100753 / JCM 10117 / KCTC 9821 / NBRC 16120 / NCIMB 702349 / NCTC 13040) TaxID=521096 RepID=D5UR79_TSUPD|nr:transcriptional regulator, AraC family [Tsukamurella paurometabola DSM 20162]SUP33963.1 Transcriptional activator feaR [Tsukamurella paurometabola]